MSLFSRSEKSGSELKIGQKNRKIIQILPRAATSSCKIIWSGGDKELC